MSPVHLMTVSREKLTDVICHITRDDGVMVTESWNKKKNVGKKKKVVSRIAGYLDSVGKKLLSPPGVKSFTTENLLKRFSKKTKFAKAAGT